MLSAAGRNMIQSTRAQHARQFAWSRMPSERELRRRAEVPAGTKEPSALAAMLGTFAPDIWDEGASQTVDIYLSAGPRGTNYGDADFRTCGHLNTATCSLHRLRFNLLTRRAVEWEVISPAASGGFSCMEDGVPGYYGTSEPAVSPEEGRLVATRRCHGSNGAAISASIQVWDNDGTAGPSVYAGAGGQTPQYGNFITDDVVIFNTYGAGGASIWYANSWPDFTTPPVRVFGPDVFGGESYQDPNVSQNAADAAGTEPRVVTFGGADGELIPRVFSGFGEQQHPFDLPQTIDGVLFYECHHPAWRPDGQQILCTRIQTAEAIDGYNVSRLYGFTYDGASVWTDPSALVEFMSPEDFNSMFPVPPTSPKVVPPISLFGKVDGLFPPSNGHPTPGTCAGYVWKYAEWCGSERYLIATVFCTDADPDVPPYQALASRVVLIDLDADTATTTAYTDLTGIIEELEGAEPGTYGGVFATCGAIPEIEEL